jgi:hypothetical protein
VKERHIVFRENKVEVRKPHEGKPERVSLYDPCPSIFVPAIQRDYIRPPSSCLEILHLKGKKSPARFRFSSVVMSELNQSSLK